MKRVGVSFPAGGRRRGMVVDVLAALPYFVQIDAKGGIPPVFKPFVGQNMRRWVEMEKTDCKRNLFDIVPIKRAEEYLKLMEAHCQCPRVWPPMAKTHLPPESFSANAMGGWFNVEQRKEHCAAIRIPVAVGWLLTQPELCKPLLRALGRTSTADSPTHAQMEMICNALIAWRTGWQDRSRIVNLFTDESLKLREVLQQREFNPSKFSEGLRPWRCNQGEVSVKGVTTSQPLNVGWVRAAKELWDRELGELGFERNDAAPSPFNVIPLAGQTPQPRLKNFLEYVLCIPVS